MSALSNAHAVTGEPSLYSTRPAALSDACGLCSLVNQWAARGLTLARSASEITKSIDQFMVVERTTPRNEIAACGSLVEWPPKIAEIRSVAVADAHQGCGAGSAVVQALIANARAESLDIIVLLTKAPEFFVKQGFEAVPVHALPAEYVEAALVARNRCTLGRTAMRMVLKEESLEHESA